MIRLYVPAEQPWTAGMTLSLPAATAHHWTRVLRARVADRAILFDGQGLEAEVELSEITKHSALLSVLSVSAPARESSLHTHLGLVMSKGDRLDYALQKAVELGVSEITLLTSERCELKLRGAEAVEKKRAHWQGVLVGACEQSGRNSLPRLHGPAALSEWQRTVIAEQKWLMVPSLTGGPTAGKKPLTLALLIGPEGGLSAAEIAAARVYDFQPWQLGPRVLRTETAPVAALAVLQWLYGDAG
jgi:16S rRNA (uracil1498-N3)-methyltransferase